METTTLAQVPDDDVPVSTDSARARTLAQLRNFGVPLTLLALFVALYASEGSFRSRTNLTNVLEQSAALGIIAVAGTLVLIAGGFDLSVGATFALAGVVAAKFVSDGGDPWIGFVLAIGAGALVGALNGMVITKLKVNAFIVTLATALIFRGVAERLTGGTLVVVDNDSFRSLGRWELLDLRTVIWVWIACAVLATVILRRTVFGRQVYAVGGNEEAARLSGIRVDRVRIVVFLFSGMAAALAGILTASRIGTGQADAGAGLELRTVAAIVVGGTSIRGGEGAIWRTVVGVLLIGIINNGFNLKGWDPVYQDIAFGAIILFAAAVDARVRSSTP